MSLPLQVYRITSDATLPTRAYDSSAAYDLYASLRREGRDFTTTIPPRGNRVIGTGLVMLAPPGHVLLICSRSGLAVRSVFVTNAPGVIDPDYVGEIKVILYNGGLEPHYVKHGDRIGQALVLPLPNVQLVETSKLPDSERGSRGFGSTGD